MEQSENNGEGFFRRNQTYLIVGLVVLIAVILIAAQRRGDNNQSNEDSQNQEQTQNQNNQNSDSQNQNPTPENQNAGSGNNAGSGSQNVSASGTLSVSDNLSRGNYMVQSNRGKVYVQTKRDYANLVGKTVALSATGTINSFTFLGFNESAGTVAGVDTTARGGAGDEASGNVNFSGKLSASDNQTFGNYMITSNAAKVYLKSVRDYTALIGSTVNLNALGSLKSFTNAKISKQ